MEHATASRVLLLHFHGPQWGRMVLGTFRDGQKNPFYVGQPFAHVQYQDNIGCPQECTDLSACNHSEELATAKTELLSALTCAADGDERLFGMVHMAKKYVIEPCFLVWTNATFFGFDIAEQYMFMVEELCHLTWPSKETLTHYYHRTSHVRDEPLPDMPVTHYYPKSHIRKDPLPDGLPVSAPRKWQPSNSRDKMAAEIVRQQYNDKMAMSLNEGCTDDDCFGPEVHKERQYEEEGAPRNKDHDISDLELDQNSSMRMFPNLAEL